MNLTTWQLLTDKVPKNLKELESILLANRGIKDKKQFFHPKHPEDISLVEVDIDPSSVKVLLKRLKQAKLNQEKVVVFGDYDVDGISATAILWQVLYAYGLDVVPFIPMRNKHGYGLSLKALPDLLALKPNLVITVDNGIVAFKPAQKLSQLGVDLIITDHHQEEIKEVKNIKKSEPDAQMRSTNESVRLKLSKPDREFAQQASSGRINKGVNLPKALAVVHSTQLCGASLAWMVAREVVNTFSIKFKVNDLLDLAGMATIADQVPLLSANRSFAYYGLKQLRKTKNVGLLALMKQAGVKDLSQVDEFTVGYVLAPRINALGRLSHGLEALRLLCSTSSVKASKRAQVLSETNLARQTLTTDAYAQARLMVKQKNLTENKIIIVSSEVFHEGVIGLIAGRLVEEFARPSLVIALGDKKIAKGSARSLPGVHITQLLRQVRQELTEVGGHPMAAGFGLEVKNLDNFTQKLTQLANETIDESLLTTQKQAEAVLPFQLVNLKLVDLLDKFRPFGMKNPLPLFELKKLKIVSLKVLGNGNKHLKLLLRPANQLKAQPLEALWWGGGEKINELEVGQALDVLVKIEKNKWNGREKVQLVMVGKD